MICLAGVTTAMSTDVTSVNHKDVRVKARFVGEVIGENGAVADFG